MNLCHLIIFYLFSCLGSLAKQENVIIAHMGFYSTAHGVRNTRTSKRGSLFSDIFFFTLDSLPEGAWGLQCIYIFSLAFTCSNYGNGHQAVDIYSFANLGFNVHIMEM